MARARNERERAKARRLRERLANGDGLDPKESRWLDRYDRYTAKPEPKRESPMKGDIALALTRALRDWRGLGGRPKVEREAHAARASLDVGRIRDASRIMEDEDAPDLPSLRGHRVSVRVKLGIPGGVRGAKRETIWVTAAALTDKQGNLANDLAKKIGEYETKYHADAIYGWQVIVLSPKAKRRKRRGRK